MKVTIIGCGALGSFFAFKFLRAGIDAQVCQRPGAQYEALRTNGIVFVDKEGKTGSVKCMVSDKLEDLAPSDIALVMVKAYQTENVAKELEGRMNPGCTVLTLQNGLGNAEALARVLGDESVAAGTCTYGAHRLQPGMISWGGDGIVRYGPWKEERELGPVEEILDRSGLEGKLEKDPRKALWEKAVLNASVNTVSALTRLENGKMLEYPETLRLIEALVSEGAAAARMAGLEVETGKMWDLVRSVLEKTASNRTSMLQDIENGRRTEVDAIVGPLIKAARVKGESLPRLETVLALVRAFDWKRESAGT